MWAVGYPLPGETAQCVVLVSCGANPDGCYGGIAVGMFSYPVAVPKIPTLPFGVRSEF